MRDDILESVFTLSFKENVAIFRSKGRRINTLSCLEYRCGIFYVMILHISIQGVGLLYRLLCFGFATTFFESDEIGSTLSVN